MTAAHDPGEKGTLYRAQVRGVGVDGWWVDGGLFAKRKDAEADAQRLADYYDAETQVIVEVQP